MAYRIVDEKFKDDLSGDGAKLYGGRWNPKGSPLLYCSEHISLCMLENMVRDGQWENWVNDCFYIFSNAEIEKIIQHDTGNL